MSHLPATMNPTHEPIAAGWGVAVRWLRHAGTLFRRAPLRFWLLALLPIVVEGLVQLLPTFGVVASKLLTPLASAWVLLMVDRRVRAGTFAPAAAARTAWGRAWSILLLAAVAVLAFAFQVGVAFLLGGAAQAGALATGNLAAITFTRGQLAAVLVSGLLPAAFMFFAAPRVVIDGLGVGAALVENARRLALLWRPVLAYTVAMGALIAGMLWQPWLLLVLLPFGVYVSYAAYRDVFDPAGPATA
ncbi:hypothetical protein [Dokdonella koreensis]|uniref:Transmembrane protein n=1 Tax=Dokdonella koreensis DS-123 TaxID=1300342 RepID=A0A160DTL6_9GAMM|nr:hypothetical protein [Dokdonella koreensis]ANB17321.1 Hypothetical protein I596_1291 [Dokdonella koreensis DS-123]